MAYGGREMSLHSSWRMAHSTFADQYKVSTRGYTDHCSCILANRERLAVNYTFILSNSGVSLRFGAATRFSDFNFTSSISLLHSYRTCDHELQPVTLTVDHDLD